ncbi:rab-like protein 6 isoform X2 [Cimex lectularius]|uniref:Rab-like protein 6 n=1 Tax=Cimex lectularius TaxID=79782 RepID=A0A8I6TMZ5_CIMLE|nr:rab-like protein 6 isoform X2 [Cimex lectularius]XP_024085960.1 rab-like protein 6 isoform X2 [Cimex lectularius]
MPTATRQCHRIFKGNLPKEFIIIVASIQWNYKTTDDVVKVEVWDIVDKGKKRTNQKIEGLKLKECDTPALDAEFIDVYKGTHGVILVLDITKVWTFNYVQKEIVKIPTDIPVLILGNHCDMSHHRTLNPEDVPYFIETLHRPKGAAQIRYTEASMSNGFGLKYIHKFFCLPFLQLQKETLLCQLEINSRELNLTVEELDIYQHGPDADYNLFLESLSKRRRQAADSSGVNLSQSCANLNTTLAHVPSIILGQGMPIDRSTSMHEMKSNSQTYNKPSTRSPDHTLNVVSQVVTSVEEFIPDGGLLDKSFLEEIPTQRSPKVQEPVFDTDSDGDVGENPLVAGYQDDVDPDDNPTSNSLYKQTSENKVDGSEKVNAWLGRINISGGRESPEGGEDSACADSSFAVKLKAEGKKKSKKKGNKYKDENSKAEKKKKRKKSSQENANDLELFLSSRDASYEAI